MTTNAKALPILNNIPKFLQHLWEYKQLIKIQIGIPHFIWKGCAKRFILGNLLWMIFVENLRNWIILKIFSERGKNIESAIYEKKISCGVFLAFQKNTIFMLFREGPSNSQKKNQNFRYVWKRSLFVKKIITKRRNSAPKNL